MFCLRINTILVTSPGFTSSIRLKAPRTDQVRNLVWLRGPANIQTSPQSLHPLSFTNPTETHLRWEDPGPNVPLR
jgi:hypothetical protein